MAKKKRVKIKTPIKSKFYEEQYQKDEMSFQNHLKGKEVMDISAFKRLMLRDIYTNKIVNSNDGFGEIDIEQVINALSSPQYNYRTLLSASAKLMRISPHYERLNNYFSNMATFCWGIDAYDIKDNIKPEIFDKAYKQLATRLEKMNLKYEFGKIMKTLPYQDIFCGLISENRQKNSFFIQKVNFEVCKIYQIQDGIYNFIIDLSAITPRNIDAYPSYVVDAYDEFRSCKDNNSSPWYLPPPENQICIKLNFQYTYPFPMLIALVRDIFDLDIYKKLKLQSARTDNYKAIMVQVPIKADTVNAPLLTPEFIQLYTEINRESLSDDIGILHTVGSKGEAISFKDSNNTRNNVADSTGNIYDSSGVSKELFNGSSSGTAVKLSIENDSAYIYALYRQFERWTNRFIELTKYNKPSYRFHFYILNSTIFNKDDVSNKYKDGCTLGAPVVDKWLSSLDLTPARIFGADFLHKNIFKFSENFIPLSSSYNGGSTEKGRPTKESEGELLTESGEKTKDSDANKDR